MPGLCLSIVHSMKNNKRHKEGADIRGAGGAGPAGAAKNPKEGSVIGARVVVGGYFSPTFPIC